VTGGGKLLKHKYYNYCWNA